MILYITILFISKQPKFILIISYINLEAFLTFFLSGFCFLGALPMFTLKTRVCVCVYVCVCVCVCGVCVCIGKGKRGTLFYTQFNF